MNDADMKARRTTLARRANMRFAKDVDGHDVVLTDDIEAVNEIASINGRLAQRRRRRTLTADRAYFKSLYAVSR